MSCVVSGRFVWPGRFASGALGWPSRGGVIKALLTHSGRPRPGSSGVRPPLRPAGRRARAATPFRIWVGRARPGYGGVGEGPVRRTLLGRANSRGPLLPHLFRVWFGPSHPNTERRASARAPPVPYLEGPTQPPTRSGSERASACGEVARWRGGEVVRWLTGKALSYPTLAGSERARCVRTT